MKPPTASQPTDQHPESTRSPRRALVTGAAAMGLGLITAITLAGVTATTAGATTVADSSSTTTGPPSAGVVAAITAGLLLLVAVAARSLVKRLGRFRLDRLDPSKLKAGGRHHVVHTFTGRVSGTMKGNETRVHGSTQVTGSIYQGTGSVSATTRIGSTNVVHDQFFLENEDGDTRGFQITNMDLAVADGQLVSVAWVIAKRRKAGPYLLVRNHTTNDLRMSSDTLTTIARGPKHTAGLLVLCWLLLLSAPGAAAGAAVVFVPALVAARLVPHLRIRRFRRSGVTPLIAALDATAAAPPSRQILSARAV